MADVTARVVAWHNRHPLACRIAPADVGAVGVVSLPFALPEPDAGAADPVEGRPGPAALRPLFDATWTYGADAGRLRRWVQAHGVYPLPGCSGWPLRHVDADLGLSHQADADGWRGRTARHVLAVVVEHAGRRTLVLVAPAADLRRAPVFGARAWSLPRLAGAATLGAALAAGWAAALVLRTAMPPTLPAAPVLAHAAPAATPASQAQAGTVAAAPPGPSVAVATPIPAEAATPAVVGAAPHGLTAPATAAGQANTAGSVAGPPPPQAMPPEATPPEAATPGPAKTETGNAEAGERHGPPAGAAVAAVPGPVPAATDTPPPDRPVTRAPEGTRLVHLQPRLSEDERRAARLASEQARRAAAQARPRDTSAPADAAPALDPKARMFAIATRPLPSREAAQAQEALLRSLMVTQPTAQRTQLELLQAQGRWRVVWWPHPQRDRAEELLLLARARGLRVELVEF